MARRSAPTENHCVRVDPVGAVLTIAEGETIMDAAVRSGYRWPTMCHGDGTCSICWVEVTTGEEHLSHPGSREIETVEMLLARRGSAGRIRLACQARVSGDVTVRKNGVRPLQGDAR
ncbi:(2Fe-2S)-binding protein [Mycolicibacterium pulveris]|uniref:2Fe-2S ferredoxin-type domain-containing protein n=1 Tax=Mycolicibacterium pulveris TaxID=36813 RepID=A0A7I7ULU6_MYCPV|nr:(2Fe-2S)-binding protein [Mycolicibacterium pulveris]BBY82444.1 hypothetical protein MPUL_36020 [Mycolicibacterium pulveris]